MTLRKLYDLIESLVQNNINLKSFDSGTERMQNNSNSKLYPQVFLERPIMIECEGDFETYKFAVLYLDMPTSITDNKSIINSQSKMHQISNQCFVYLNDLIDINQLSKVTLEKAFSDQVTGLRVEYELKTVINVNPCELSEP